MADEELFGFHGKDVERISKVVNHVEANNLQSPNQLPRRSLQPSRIIVGILTSAISATTSLIGPPKVGTLNVYSFSSTGTEDTGIDEPIYNFAPSAATTDRWSIAERDSYTGKFVLTTQFCS